MASPTLAELLAEQQRRSQLAELLGEQERRAQLLAPSALVTPDLPPDTPTERPPIPEVQAQRVLELAAARGAEAARAMREVTERPAAEIREQETARALREIEAEREKVVVPGVAEPVTFEPAGPAVFRPTRIVETAAGRFYRNPETGELTEPTLSEEVRESFALQTLTGEEEARRLTGEGAAAPKGILGTRESGAGIVETTFGSLLRSIPGYVEAAVGEAYFRGLGYEVDAEDNPVDPEDWGLALKEGREALGLPAVWEYNPALFATTPLRHALKAAGLESGAEALEETLGARSVGIPLPGIKTTQRVAMKIDPEGRRKVSTVEVPDFLEDPSGFLEAEARRIAQNVAAGRTLGDEFRDAPELVSYYERVWDDPDYAYWAGTLSSLPIPILGGAGAAPKALAAGVKKVVPLTELVRKADEAAVAAKAAQAQLAAEAAPDAMRSAARQFEAAKLSLIEAGGGSFANAGALVGVGRRGEERVAQRVADLVVKGTRDLTDAQKAAVTERLASGVGRSGAEAAEKVKQAVLEVAPDQEDLAQQMHRQTLLNVPDDFVMITETRAAPRAIAGEVREVMRAKTAQAVADEGDAFRRLTPEEKAVRVSAIQDEIVDEVSSGLSRRTSELTDLQVRTHDATRTVTDLARYKPFDTLTGRRLRVLSPGFKLDEVTAASRELGAKLRRAGQDAGQQVSRELARLSKAAEEGSVTGALNRLMREQAEQTARAQGTDVSSVTSAMWDKTLEALVGRVEGGATPKALQDFMRETVDVSKAPTVSTVQGLEASLVADTSLKFAAQGRRFKRAADVQRAMLKSLMEEGIKKQLGPDRASYEALRQGLGEDPLGPARGSVEELLIDKRAQDAAVALAREVPVSVLPSTPYRVPFATQLSDLEEKLATNAAELVTELGKVEPRLRQTYAQVVADATKYLLVPGRAGLIQRAKYGYMVPNLPYLVYKGLETPFIAATQLGAARTLASLPRAGRSLLQRLTRRHLTGGGITTAEGVYYSPEELLRLGEVEGLGMTSIDAQRVSLLTDDILAAARRASKETPVRSMLSPFQKGFYARTAEAMEQSFRQGIFEAELIAGATPTEAARAARQGALDYNEIPSTVRNIIEPMFPAAGTAYKLLSAVTIAGLKNPSALGKALRALRENKRRQDPADLAGDSTIANMLVGDEDSSSYLPIPGVSRLITAVEVARHGSNLMTDLSQAAAAARATGRSTPALWLERVGDDVVPLAWTLADAAFPLVMNAYQEFETVSAALPEKQQKTASEDAAMWAAAMWAHNADPEHDDAWKTFEQIFQWREVEPPAERSVKGREGYWRTVPPGLPHVAVRDIETGDIMYKVLELTDTGRENLAMITAMTPESIERAIPTASAMLQGTESVFSEDAPIIKRIYVPSKIDTWKEALISQFLNPTGIDFSDPEGVRKAQAARVLEVRAVPE